MRLIPATAAALLLAATAFGAIVTHDAGFEVPDPPTPPAVPEITLPTPPKAPSIALPGGAPPAKPPAPDPLSSRHGVMYVDAKGKCSAVDPEEIHQLVTDARELAALARAHAEAARLHVRDAETEARHAAGMAREMIAEQQKAIEEARVAIEQTRVEIDAMKRALDAASAAGRS